MSTTPQPGRIPFERTVARLTETLTAATVVVAQANVQAQPRAKGGGVAAGLRRILGAVPAVPQPEAAAEEIALYGRRLRELHARLRSMDQGQLGRDAEWVARRLPAVVAEARKALQDLAYSGQEPGGRDASTIATEVRSQVQQWVGLISPPNVVPGRWNAAPAPESILPHGARAFAAGHADTPRFTARVHARAEKYWMQRLKIEGLNLALPTMREEVRNPLDVARLVNTSLDGVVLGTRLDPATRWATRPTVIDPNHTVLAMGASGIGKTTSVVVPYAVSRAAMGDNVVCVTPQTKTIGDILPTAKALSGQEKVTVIDFGGEIITPDSPEFVTWDVTRNCLTTAGAMEFADAFAGDKLPARANLNNSEYWGGIVWDMYAAAGHIAAGMREVRGIDPNGLNGMARVYDLLRAPRPGDLPTELPAHVRAALERDPAALRAQEELFQAARSYAEGFNPRLQRMAFQAHILKAAGLALSDEIVGEKLESLSEVLNQVAKSKTGDPMESLITTFKRAVPPHERLVMSPREGVREIDPKDLVRPGAGVSFVTYAHTSSTGLAAGAFTSRVLDEAIRANKDAAMLESMGGSQRLTRLSLVVDEGGAARYIPRLPEVVTDTRQMGISALVSATSPHHLRDVLGPEDAGKFLQAPCVVDMSPDGERAAAIAPLFGQQVVERMSTTHGMSGGGVTRAEQKENILDASDLAKLPRGQALVLYPSNPAGDRVQLVKLPHLDDPSTLVGAAAEYVNRHPEHYEPVSEVFGRFRPDLTRQQDVQRNPAAALLDATDSPSAAAAIADPEVSPEPPARPTEPVPQPPADGEEDHPHRW